MTNEPESARHRRMTWKSLGWTLFALLLVFNLIFFGFDAYPIAERKIARIGIGTLDEAQFEQKVVERSLAMLENPPDFRLNDETRYLLFEHAAGRMSVDPGRFLGAGQTPSVTDNVDPFLMQDTSPLGLLADGVCDYASEAGDPSLFLNALEGYAARFLDGDRGLILQPRSVEQTGQGMTMLHLAKTTGKPTYRLASDQIAAFYLDTFRETGQPVPYTVWGNDRLALVDTLGIMCPFLTRYGAETGNAEAMDLAVFQLEDFLRHAFDEETGLPIHGYNPTRGQGLVGVACWGRGSGWLALGLQQVVKWLPDGHPKKASLRERYRAYAVTLATKQRPDGTWGTMHNLAESQADMSATAMLTHFFLYGQEADILGPEFDQPIKLAMEALRHNTRRDGTLDFCQGPVGDLIRHSRTWGPNLFGQGALMSCLSYEERPNVPHTSAPRPTEGN